jgi:dihydrofolate reductase
VKHFKAIAAMSLNRVIGYRNTIPWHIPEDLKWFKKLTVGHIIVMGRKTFESIGKPLPGRRTIVLSRSTDNVPGAEAISSLDQLPDPIASQDIFICGGAQIYAQTLPQCSDLYLTLVQRVVEGDAFFPPFEDAFEPVEEIAKSPEFIITHYRNRKLSDNPARQVS